LEKPKAKVTALFLMDQRARNLVSVTHVGIANSEKEKKRHQTNI
jgi:hypothetical protein